MAQNLNAQAIANALGKAKPSGKGFMCCCPVHEDKNPSLYICDKPEGGVFVRCYAECSYQNVIAALKSRGLWPESGQPRSPFAGKLKKDRKRLRDNVEIISPVPTDAAEPNWDKLFPTPPSHIYDYRNSTGALLMYVVRHDILDGKSIRPLVYARDGTGAREWIFQSLPEPRPLYRREKLAARPDSPVLIVEGEKAVNAGQTLFPDHVTVTWPGGAAAVGKVDWSPLAGRDVILWPDNDAPGRKAMDEVAALLKPVAKSIRQVMLPASLPENWDIADGPPDDFDPVAALQAAKPALTGLRKDTMTIQELLSLPIEPREFLVEPWLPKGSLAMIWATRGQGKTWVAMSLAVALASGKDFLCYKVPSPQCVLFIDGEMTLADLKERFRLFPEPPPGNLHILPSERLYAAGCPLNINDPKDQKKILDLLEDLKKEGINPSTIILDNLSSLTAGIDENDNSALDCILQWMALLRHSGVTVVSIHHANKSGDQRGASRREDRLDTSIRLAKPDDKAPPHSGAHFVWEFTKTRGKKPNPSVLEVKLIEKPDGTVEWSFAGSIPNRQRFAILRFIAENKPRMQQDIADQMQEPKGSVSKHCKALVDEGLIIRSPLEVTPEGALRLVEIWPELETILMTQGKLPI